MNALPKYWAVKNDPSDKRCRILIDYLNSFEEIIKLDGASAAYYGITTEGVSVRANFISLKGNPKILDIEEFINLLNCSSTINDNYQIF